jgi:hypothetical protein
MDAGTILVAPPSDMQEYLIFDNAGSSDFSVSDIRTGIVYVDASYVGDRQYYDDQIAAPIYDGAADGDQLLDNAIVASKDSSSPATFEGKSVISFADTPEKEPADDNEPIVVPGRPSRPATFTDTNSSFLLDIFGDGGYGIGNGGLSFGSIGAETSTPGDGQDEVLVVTATRAQVKAARIARARAEFELNILGYGLTAFEAYIGSKGGFKAVGTAISISLTGDFSREFFIQARADELYQLDGLDGTYDGFSQEDMAQYRWTGFPNP